MRWGRCILAVALLLVAVTLAQEGGEEVSKIEVSEIEKQTESEIGETAELVQSEPDIEREPEIPRRSRIRPSGNKRRRRMRKKHRTTPSPVEDSTEILPFAEQSTEIFFKDRPRRIYEEEVQPEEPPRRRPGKRRRRPAQRRYPDRDYPERLRDGSEPPRKRRKGHRKRRPEIATEEEHEAVPTTQPPQEIEHEPSSTTEEAINANDVPIHLIEPNVTEDAHEPEVETTSNIIQDDPVIVQVADETKTETPEEPKTDPTTKVPEFGAKNKLFDRRTLFPSARNLPPTSAVIRRRLLPKRPDQEEKKDPTPKNDIEPSSLLPQGFTTSLEFISPTQLIENFRSTVQEETSEEPTEEPNYPKVTPAPKQNKTEEVKETTTVAPTKEPSSTTYGIKVNISIQKLAENNTTEKIPNYKSITLRTDELKVESVNIPPGTDELIELLKTDSPRLAKILEARNMTLIDLIAHRERGSSQLHFSGSYRTSTQPTVEAVEEVEETAPEVEEPAPEVEEPQPESEQPQPPQPEVEPETKITFPSDDVMGSFPTFVEQIEKQDDKENETREARVYEEKKPDELYTWRVIPNPKLTPVSVRGQYEEITGNKPYHENEVLIGEYDSPVVHKNDLGGQLSAESIRTKASGDYTSFRRIPPGMKSAIIVSGAILVMAIFGFLSVLISCRVRQRKVRMRAKRDILCEHLQNEDFMASQRSLSPVLTKTREPVFTQGIHSNTTSNRHYYLWRTLRKTFQYD